MVEHLIHAAPALELTPTTSSLSQQLLASLQKPTTPETPMDPSAESSFSESNPQDFTDDKDLFTPLKITLQPQLELAPLPLWAKVAPQIHPDASCVEIRLPALSEEATIESFAITVNFNDVGDGGPLLEWIKPDGERLLICSGLGINGPPIGQNSRTLAIPYDLALDGGTIVVSHTGRFEHITSILIRPGRTALVSALGSKITPAIIDESLHVIEKESSEGATPLFKSGNSIHNRTTFAELKAPIEQLSGDLEFVFALTDRPQATIFRTEVQGLDLDAHIEVLLNDVPIGSLNMQSFELDAPELILTHPEGSKEKQLQLAGWRNAHLYLPPSLWKDKEVNHLVLIIKNGLTPSHNSIHLKNSTLELLQAVEKEP